MDEVTEEGLITFLQTKRSIEELRVALEILTEFKNCEAEMEWLLFDFITWQRLEQFQDYLKILVGKGEDVDDETAKEYHKNL